MSKLVHALEMKLRESVNSKVAYKVISVTHLQAIFQVKNEVSNSGTFSVVPRSFNANVNAGVTVEWIVRVLCNSATGVRSAESALPILLCPVKVIA